MKTAILAIFLFLVMIFPHELGHFIAARKCGVQVNEFSFGMGPAIWKKQKGETLYSIRLFPVGGYCAMEGEDGQDEEPNPRIKHKTENGEVIDDEEYLKAQSIEPKPENPRAFSARKPWQKIIILMAGSFMNVVCALVIMILVVGIMGFNTTVIDKTTEGSAAEAAGLMAGDKILTINGDDITSWSEVSAHVAASEGEEMDFTVLRGKEEVKLSVIPTLTTGLNANGEEVEGYVIGITSRISHSPGKAVVNGAASTWRMAGSMFTSLRMLFTGEVGADELSGPVGMVQLVNETTSYGLWYYGFLMSMICLNLAIINMLPLPALDGGRIIFCLFTWITGKTVSARVEGTVHAVGLVLLLGLMIYVTGNDIIRIFG